MKECWECSKEINRENAVKGEEEYWPQTDEQSWGECDRKTISANDYFGTYKKIFCSQECRIIYNI